MILYYFPHNFRGIWWVDSCCSNWIRIMKDDWLGRVRKCQDHASNTTSNTWDIWINWKPSTRDAESRKIPRNFGDSEHGQDATRLFISNKINLVMKAIWCDTSQRATRRTCLIPVIIPERKKIKVASRQTVRISSLFPQPQITNGWSWRIAMGELMISNLGTLLSRQEIFDSEAVRERKSEWAHFFWPSLSHGA